MHTMKTKNGKTAAIEVKFVVGVQPTKDGYEVMLRKENGDIEHLYLDISQEEADGLVKAVNNARAIKIA